ncbi:DUF2243 domain-containing protein [Haloferacaceae archaeon DSL9]
MVSLARRRLLLWGGMVGFGFGAVVDTVLFHLILQTHHLLSGMYDPYSYDGFRTNVMIDGLFIALMLGVSLVGAGMLWRAANRADRALSTRYLVGSIVVGMGVFNLLDGIVSHYVLDLHNVVHGTEAWNPPWVLISVLLLAIGAFVLYASDPVRGSPDG